ncbi:winged helix-turn-helix domain-containing protein [Colwelliaceae bacterium 6441]
MTVYQSENWTFVSDSQELIYHDGHKQQLPSRISACLLTLISSAGKTVSYDELLLKVWGTTHKDASTISSVISEVRKLIGCGKGGIKIIVTVPKRGYRYTQPVNIVDDEQWAQVVHDNEHNLEKRIKPLEKAPLLQSSTIPKDTTSSTESDLHNNPVKYKQWIILVAFVALLATVFTITSLFDFSNASSVKKVAADSFGHYEVLSHETGREDEFDVSRDGRWITYVNKAPNVKPSLIVQELSSGRKQTLVASGDYYFGSPVFSSDAKQLVFHKQSEQHCEVWLADLSAFNLEPSKTKKLTDCGKAGFWSTTAFSQDGNHIFFSRANALTDPFKVYQLDLRTLFERSITAPTSSGRGDYSFSVSPDTKRLAVVRNVLWQESHIVLMNTLDNQSETVLELPYLIAKVAWLDDEHLLYCDKNKGLWSYDLTLKKQTKLAQLSFSCHYPVVADKQLYAIKKVSTKNAIWTLTKGEGEGDKFAMQPLIDSPYYDFNAMFGPNNSLYFFSDRSGELKLWQKTQQGFQQHKHVNLPKHAREVEFSVETNTLYGLSEKRLFRYDLSLGELEWLSKEQHEVFNFSISDDGTLLFSEGSKEYWTLKSLDLFTLKITNLGINAFSVRQYNGNLYFTKFHEKGLWKKDLHTGGVEKIFEDINIKFTTFWDIWDNNTLIWATDNRLKIFDLHTAKLLDESLTYEGHVGFLKCHKARLMCTFSLRERAESEIVRFGLEL